VPLQPLVYLDGPGDAHDVMAEHVHGDTHDTADDQQTAPAAVSSEPAVPLPRALQKLGLGTTSAPTEAPAAEHSMANMSHGGSDHAAMSGQSQSVAPPASSPSQLDHSQMTPAQMAAHGADGMTHDATGMGAMDGHATGAPARQDVIGFTGRGLARLDATGAWTATVRIRDASGQALLASAQVNVVDGGPNPLYLATTGLLIGGSLLFGMIQRRRELVRGR
jgi:hypothetical protein